MERRKIVPEAQTFPWRCRSEREPGEEKMLGVATEREAVVRAQLKRPQVAETLSQKACKSPREAGARFEEALALRVMQAQDSTWEQMPP